MSSSSKPESSSSIFTHNGITSAFSLDAYSFTCFTNSSFSASSNCSSDTFAIYKIGLVVNKNYEVAGEWFKKAAEHGDIEGKDNVSLLEGVEPEQLPTLAERLAFGFNYLSTKELEEFIKVYENQEKDDAVTDEAE